MFKETIEIWVSDCGERENDDIAEEGGIFTRRY